MRGKKGREEEEEFEEDEGVEEMRLRRKGREE